MDPSKLIKFSYLKDVYYKIEGHSEDYWFERFVPSCESYLFSTLGVVGFKYLWLKESDVIGLVEVAKS